MHVLSKDEFWALKQSDTIVIYGCGYSIRKITGQEQEQFNALDSIATNWFLKSSIPVKFYLVREQANNSKRVNREQGEDVDSFFRDINSPPYDRSYLIVHDLSDHSRKIFHYHTNIGRFNHKGIVIKDVKLPNNDTNVKRWRKKNFFKTGVIHGVMTLTNALHIAINMRYERIIFVGIDLTDSRYFWLGKKETRHTVRQKGQKFRSPHATGEYTLNLINQIKKYHKIKMYVHNKRSLLTQLMPVWES